MDCSTPSLPVHHQLPEFTQTHVHWVGDAIQPSHPLWPPSPPAFNLSHFKVFSKESVLHIWWPKYWRFSLSISPSNEYSGLISFRIEWLWSPCSPRDSQESSPTPQFKHINSSALSFLYSPTLTAIQEYWGKNDYCIRSGILYYSLLFIFFIFWCFDTYLADPGETSQFLDTANNLPKSMLLICKPTITPMASFV